MSFDIQDRSISNRAREVKCDILTLLQILKTRSQEDQHVVALEDLLDRYKLWAGNLGALHQSTKKISLDYRLLSAPQIQDKICKHLDALKEAINECRFSCIVGFQLLLIP